MTTSRPCGGARPPARRASSGSSSTPRSANSSGSTGRWLQSTLGSGRGHQVVQQRLAHGGLVVPSSDSSSTCLERQHVLVGVRLHGLHAAGAGGAEHPGDAVRVQHRRQALRLGLALVGERSLGRPSPSQALRLTALAWRTTTSGVVLRAVSRTAEQVDVVEVGQASGRLVQSEPAEVVDLVVDLVRRHVVVADHVADPVVHHLRPAAADGVQLGTAAASRAGPRPRSPRATSRTAVAGHVLARVLLALGERPVVVLGPVDQQHLAALADDHRARGDDIGVRGPTCG